MTSRASFLRLAALPASLLLCAALPALADDSMPGAPPPPAPAAPGAPPVSGKFFDAYDGNQDGKVTRQEFLDQKGDEEVFGLLDKDQDGTVTLEEVGLPADYKPKPLPPAPAGRPGRPGGGGGAMAEQLRKLREALVAMDADKDGKVSREEYKGDRPFDRLDRNKDGFLDAADFGRGREAAQVEQHFKELDKNGDGKLSADEVPNADRFRQLDKDADGSVTLDEMRAAPPFRGGRGPDALRGDRNGDGKIARDEFPGSDEAFRGLDADGDGSLTRDELAKGRPGKGAPPTPPAETTPPAEPMPPAPGGARGGALFAALDKDGDGRLARNEFPGDDAAWRSLDRDADGWITAGEAERGAR